MAAYTSQVQARDFYGGVATVPLAALFFLSTQNNGLAFAFLLRFPVQAPYRRNHRIRIDPCGMYLGIDCATPSIKALLVVTPGISFGRGKSSEPSRRRIPNHQLRL